MAIDRKRMGAFPEPVSRLCLGTMMFGGPADRTASLAMLERYCAAGGNFIDTADVYCDGASERVVGEFLRAHGGGLVVATKGGNQVPEIDDAGGLGGARLRRACALSLERLGIDRIPLYYLHREDLDVLLEETVAAVATLLADGMIGAWAVSNFRPWKLAELIRLAERHGMPRPVAVQPYYHLLTRVPEPDLLPACRHYGLGVVSYSPLARGVLTAKYAQGTPEGSRAARGDRRLMETEFHPETIARAREVADYAARSGRRPADLAIRWVLANDAITSVLAGPRTIAQLDDYLAALDTRYDAEDEAFLSGLCATGHTPVPGFNDPRYPLEGRYLSL